MDENKIPVKATRERELHFYYHSVTYSMKQSLLLSGFILLCILKHYFEIYCERKKSFCGGR